MWAIEWTSCPPLETGASESKHSHVSARAHRAGFSHVHAHSNAAQVPSRSIYSQTTTACVGVCTHTCELSWARKLSVIHFTDSFHLSPFFAFLRLAFLFMSAWPSAVMGDTLLPAVLSPYHRFSPVLKMGENSFQIPQQFLFMRLKCFYSFLPLDRLVGLFRARAHTHTSPGERSAERSLLPNFSSAVIIELEDKRCIVCVDLE